MNDITKTPAAELVGKIQKLDAAYENAEMGGSSWIAERNTISQELDRRCAEMRISLWNGLFKADNPETSGVDFDEDGGFEGIAHVFITTKPASELHALLGWLLMKETK